MHVRTCPDCGEEFQPHIVRCSDCGALLVDADDEPSAAVADAGDGTSADTSAPEAAEDYTAVFISVGSEAMRAAAEALAAAGIGFRATGNSAAFQLLVPRDEVFAAIEALAGHEGAIGLTPDTTAPGEENARCPACGTTLAAGAEECPECQLVLGGEEGDPAPGGGSRDDE